MENKQQRKVLPRKKMVILTRNLRIFNISFNAPINIGGSDRAPMT